MGSRWWRKESIRHKHRYSDEQKQVAGEHYLNHGCCPAFTSRARVIPALMCSLAGLMNFIPTDDVYLPVRPTRLCPLNQKSNVRLSWHSVHDKYQPVKSPGVLVSVVRYCINGKMKLSATVLTRLCVNITNLPGGRTRCVAGGSRPTESGNTPPADGAGYSEKAEEIIKKTGHQYQSPEQQRKTKIADALRQTYPLTELLHVLGLAVAVIFITGLH